MTEAYDGRQVVGMDLHRRRSVLVRMTEDGRKLETVRTPTARPRWGGDRPGRGEAAGGDRGDIRLVLGRGRARGRGGEVHLAHPLGVKAFSYRRVKNDERDCTDLADLLRMGKLPEAWIAPPEIRGRREITRYRHKLAGQRTSCKDQVHAVLAKSGIPVTRSDIFGPGGRIGWTGCRWGSRMRQGRLAARADRRAVRRDRTAGGAESSTAAAPAW